MKTKRHAPSIKWRDLYKKRVTASHIFLLYSSQRKLNLVCVHVGVWVLVSKGGESERKTTPTFLYHLDIVLLTNKFFDHENCECFEK